MVSFAIDKKSKWFQFFFSVLLLLNFAHARCNVYWKSEGVDIFSQSRKMRYPSEYSSLDERYEHDSSLSKQKPCHKAINKLSHNSRMALERYFWFNWYCKKPQFQLRDSMSNYEIYIPVFSVNDTYNFGNIFLVWSYTA